MADTLSFRLAAETLHISTPALSKQVKDLEEEIGARLLDRDTTQVQLTNAGQVFLTEAKLILSHADRAVKQAREAEKGQRGRLAIGNVGPLTASYMATALNIFCSRFPDVDVDLIDVDIPAQLQALQSGMVQLGFLPALEAEKLPSGFVSMSVLVAPLGIAISEGHRLAHHDSISLKEIEHERLLCIAGPTSPAPHLTYVNTLLSARGLKTGRVSEVRGVESLFAMIAGGQGISVLAGRRFMRVDNIVVRSIKESGPDTEVDIRAVWREGATGLLDKNFVDVFRSLDHHSGKRGTGSKKVVAK